MRKKTLTKVFIGLVLLLPFIVSSQSVYRWSQGGTNSAGPYASSSVIVSNGIKFIAMATSTLGLPTFSDLSDYFKLSDWFATTTDALDEGLTNKYYTQARVWADIWASSTLAVLLNKADTAIQTETDPIFMSASTSLPYVVTETDPVFTASFASSIASSTNWDTAFSWGNWATGIWASSTLATILNNAQTAYSWGNHASAGYLTNLQGGLNAILGDVRITRATTTHATTTNLAITGLANTFLAVNGLGQVIATTTPTGGSGFSTSSADFWLTTKSTTDIAEGTNKYYTQQRVWDDILASSTIVNAIVQGVTAFSWGNHAYEGYLKNLSSLTTDNLAEGSTNKYYTQARTWSDIWASSTLATILNNAVTAYGWGNHATAGYALSSSLADYVLTSFASSSLPTFSYASSTYGLRGETNTWSGGNIFNGFSTTTGLYNSGTVSTNFLTLIGFGNGLLKSTSGLVGLASAGTDYVASESDPVWSAVSANVPRLDANQTFSGVNRFTGNMAVGISHNPGVELSIAQTSGASLSPSLRITNNDSDFLNIGVGGTSTAITAYRGNAFLEANNSGLYNSVEELSGVYGDFYWGKRTGASVTRLAQLSGTNGSMAINIGNNDPVWAFQVATTTGSNGMATFVFQNFRGTGSDSRILLSNSSSYNMENVGAIIEADRTDSGGAGSTDLNFYNSLGTTMTKRLTLLANGNFGYNTSTPSVRFDIYNNADVPMFALQDTDGRCTYNPESSSVTVACTSDKDLKTNIVDAELVSELENLMKYDIKEYTIKASGNRTIGVIADELEKVLPEKVTEDNGTKMVELPSIWSVVASIQELVKEGLSRDEKIQSQELRIKALEEQNELLRKRLDRLEAGDVKVGVNLLDKILRR